jgi:hypothetical protein
MFIVAALQDVDRSGLSSSYELLSRLEVIDFSQAHPVVHHAIRLSLFKNEVGWILR